MKKCRALSLFSLGALFCASTALAQSNNYEFRIIYSLMKNKDIAGLQNAKENGVWIDATDSYDVNSLCYAVYQKDYDGYELLKALQANPNPPCLDKMSDEYRDSFFANKPYSTKYAYLYPKPETKLITPAVQTTAVIAGIAAGTAIGIAGGGASGESGEDEKNPNPPTTTGFPSPLNLNPASFQTAEFNKGNFLDNIGAQYAYARGYTGYKVSRNADGSLTDGENSITTDKINVAIFDGGVYSNNPKLNPNILKDVDGNVVGYNYDFGPCTTTNNTTCFKYDGTNLYLESGGTEQLLGAYSPQNWAEYIKHFKTDYVWSETDSTPHYVEDPNIDPDAMSSHGTHVAGIVGAITDGTGMHGVAPNVNLMPVIFNPILNLNTNMAFFNDISTYTSIVNMSFGPESTASFNAQNYGDYFANTDALTDFFDKNSILVAAAGNEGQAQPSAPSATPNEVANAANLFLTVVAVDNNNVITNYSNHCGAASAWCIAAPGGTADSPIYSTTGENGFGDMIGTSMAAPTVSGSLAVLLGAFPNLTPQQAVEILFTTATDLGAAGIDDIYGHGLVNLNAATAPIGTILIPGGDSTTSSLLALNNTRISLPHNVASVMEQLPEKLIVLDKYARAYPVTTKSLFQTTDARDVLKNDMEHFIRHDKVNKVKFSDEISMSFTNKISDVSGDLPLGSMEFNYKTSDNNNVQFSYSENTQYNQGDYFSKARSNPFINMNDAYGLKSQYAINETFGFDVGIFSGKNGFYNDDERLRMQNDNNMSAIDYLFSIKPSEYVTFGIKGGFLQESGSVLGMRGSGAFATDDTMTIYNGLELALTPLADISIIASYYQGQSKTGKSSNNSLMSMSDLTSESLSLDVGYQMNSEEKFGLQIASPLSIRGGSMMFDLPISRDPTEDIIYRERYSIAMRAPARELDFGLYFNHENIDESWYRAELGTRINPDGLNVAPDYRMMLGYGSPLN